MHRLWLAFNLRIHLYWYSLFIYLDMRFIWWWEDYFGWLTKANPLLAKPPLLRRGKEPKPLFFPSPLCENERAGHQSQWKMHPFSSSNQLTAPTCHNSPALLSHDVKTLSCGEWQQLGRQMLTFKDGWCSSLLLSIPLIPLVRAGAASWSKGGLSLWLLHNPDPDLRQRCTCVAEQGPPLFAAQSNSSAFLSRACALWLENII